MFVENDTLISNLGNCGQTSYILSLANVCTMGRVNIRYRVRTVEYFKFPNLEGATVWEKLINMGAKRK